MIASSRNIKVLVVDDSALVRQVAIAVLSQEPGLHVTVASDPLAAMDKMARERPDVILLDLEMPRMHGLTFLRKIMSEDPIPVVVCSGAAASGDATAIAALEQGAVAIITKPKLGVSDFLHESALTLIDTIVGAAHARLRPRYSRVEPSQTAEAVVPKQHFKPNTKLIERIVVVGASTGGPEVISEILQQLTPECPGIVIVQHMPEAFTGAYSRRLNTICRIEVKEAEQGDEVRRGRALIAPGNRHIVLHRDARCYTTGLLDGPLVNRHRPSVDVLFRSAAQTAGPDALGIILTGMGSDGAQALLEMKNAGAVTFAQNEATSIVFGMPREAITLGAVDTVASPAQIAAAIATWPTTRVVRAASGTTAK
jgi:two-component system, chemotaxis family, protein-glutamate methylesterase/glutaminase